MARPAPSSSRCSASWLAGSLCPACPGEPHLTLPGRAIFVGVIVQRPATDLSDLVLAESVLTAVWLDGAPFAASHPGDLEWWYASVAPDPLDVHLRLWFVDHRVRAWSWIRGHLVHWEVHPDDSVTDDELLDAILEAAIAETTGRLEAWVPEDDQTTQATVGRLGFRRARCYASRSSNDALMAARRSAMRLHPLATM